MKRPTEHLVEQFDWKSGDTEDQANAMNSVLDGTFGSVYQKLDEREKSNVREFVKRLMTLRWMGEKNARELFVNICMWCAANDVDMVPVAELRSKPGEVYNV